MSASLFHVPEGIYLLSHSVGCLPVSARAALDEALLEPWANEGSDAWPAWLDGAQRFRAALAGLLGGQAAHWCPQPGVSAAVFRILSALPAGDRKTLLVSRHAFPSIGYALSGLERFGYRLRFVDGDPADLAIWRSAMTPDVAAAVFMHVHSNTGIISPLPELASMARERGIFTIADICQSAGIVPLDVTLLGVDAVAGSCVKWLCGGPGAGFLWASPEVLDRLTPPDRGWFSHADPFEFAIDRFRYAEDALRFWGGTPSIAPFVLATEGIRMIGQFGVGRVWTHNRQLCSALVEGVPEDIRRRIVLYARGGTLCLDYGAFAVAEEERLRSAGCKIDRRDHVIRMSFHIFNTEEEGRAVAALLASSQNALKSAGA